MATKETIETTLGTVWVTRFDGGDVRLWWPPNARVDTSIREVIDGRAAFRKDYGGWIVPRVHADDVLSEIGAI